MKKLYKIWLIVHNVNKPSPFSYVIEENGDWAYPLVEILSIMSYRWSREDFVSMDLDKLLETCKYLNEMRDENEHYEIREVDVKELEGIM